MDSYDNSDSMIIGHNFFIANIYDAGHIFCSIMILHFG